MSLSWDPDDASSDEADRRTRLATWFSPSPGELAGLAVLLVGALVLSAVLWVQAVARPTTSEPSGGHGDTAGHDHATDGHGPAEIGVAMDADGTAAGHAPGVDEPADGRGRDDAAGRDPAGAVPGDDGAAAAAGGGPDEPGREPGTVVVHVTGAVHTAGVVALPAGARIGDAVTAAGGTSPDALFERVNLARLVADGEHIHVPREGDDPATLPPIGGVASAPGGGATGGAAGDQGSGEPAPVHLNRASAEELTALPGIGPARAEAIVTHREQHGPFATPGDLRAVSGIGEATFQRLAPLITVE